MDSNNLNECKKYMLDNNKLKNIESMIEEMNKIYIESKDNDTKIDIKEKVSKNKSKKYSYFFTNNDDKLFWYFYVIVKGEHEYEINNNFKIEKEFKINAIENLRKIKNELKVLKLSLTSIEDELLNHKKIGIKSLIALAFLYKKNLIYIWKRCYFEIINNKDENINVIINENNYIKLLNDNNSDLLNRYRDEYLQIDNIDKPFKSITSYSKNELLVIATKLDINNIDNKITKKDLYEKIKMEYV